MIKTNKKTLILGSEGQLGGEFVRKLELSKVSYAGFDYAHLDITNKTQMEAMLQTIGPDLIINCTAFNHVDQAEKEKAKAYQVNQEAVENLARLCHSQGIFLVHFSSDYVFNGQKGTPYTEEDQPDPISVYGHSKWEGEKAVEKYTDQFLIFRLSWLFGQGKNNFLFRLEEWAKNTDRLQIACDETSVPTFTEDVVEFTFLALNKRLEGLYHLTNSGYCSRLEWARYYFERIGRTMELIPVPADSFRLQARRPAFSAMSNKKLADDLKMTPPTWQDAVERFLEKLGTAPTFADNAFFYKK